MSEVSFMSGKRLTEFAHRPYIVMFASLLVLDPSLGYIIKHSSPTNPDEAIE